MNSRPQALVAVLLVWAAIYLPALGSLEIKGEEGRRILPAVQMIETGDYIVPKVGSEPYLRKPPLINWLVAVSFKIFGQRNEWTARLPSVLCVLAVAVVFITVARVSLGATGSTVAALIWLTSFGMIEKGRLIEIEALYVSLFAIAFVCWLSWWEEERSVWLTWIVPWIFLGLGWLAKGPTHLFFFYAIVIAVLWRSRELRTIWNVPHLIGLIVMISIFAAWAIPLVKMTRGGHVAQVWSRQFSGRLAGEGLVDAEGGGPGDAPQDAFLVGDLGGQSDGLDGLDGDALRQRGAVDHDDVQGGIGQRRQFAHDRAVDGDTALGDEALSSPP